MCRLSKSQVCPTGSLIQRALLRVACAGSFNVDFFIWWAPSYPNHRKKEFKDGFIRAHIIAAKDDPRLPENKDKGKAREPSRSVSPPVRGAGLPQPTRQSARTRQAATAGKKNIQRIDISPDTTVKDFKCVRTPCWFQPSREAVLTLV